MGATPDQSTASEKCNLSFISIAIIFFLLIGIATLQIFTYDSPWYSSILFFAAFAVSGFLLSEKKKGESLLSDLERIIISKNNHSQKLSQREAELARTNSKLKRINQEFQKTAEQLFNREKELIDANKKLHEIDKVKSEFVSVAAHQLRTPLTGIKWSYLSLLEADTGTLNEDQRKIAEEGLRTITYSIDIINDLLNSAHFDEGKVEFNYNDEPIVPIIREALERNKNALEDKNTKLEADLPTDSPILKIDREQISIVFDNLIVNAIKYTPAKGKISIRIFRSNHEITFKVQDSGIGIPKSDLDRVFTKFFRAQNAITFQTSGTGLGLHVAKTIIEKHGGNIHLESEEGKGTTVVFSLPITT